MSFAKRRRAQKREDAEAFNAAREAIERDMAEMEEAYQAQQARFSQLTEAEMLTPAEYRELLDLSGAPAAITDMLDKVALPISQPKLIVPGA